jgi:hypothetical protein
MILVLTFNLGTTKIWTVKSWYNLVLIVLWFAAIAFDFFTSLTGNYIFIAPAKLSDNITNFALWGFTLLITACPAIMVFFLPEAINSQE